jgi:hypothetical protein
MPALPITRVVLYKHGVGYFEREGPVENDATLAFTFKQGEVSDVLKSLTVLDLGGGHITAVSYDSTTPLAQLLADIALSIPDDNSLVGLLQQIKGARMAVHTGVSPVVEGNIVGIDHSERSVGDAVVKVLLLSLLTDAGDIRSFDLHALLGLQLLDGGLRRDLDYYLKTQLSAKKKDARTFTFFAQGQGKRTIRLSYTLEAPVWKATYRILLGEPEAQARDSAKSIAGASGSPQLPMIQGWAVVDNTQDEDWDNVALSLISGLPVSFVHDLYTPRYIKRPIVEVKETNGVLPPEVEEGMQEFFIEETVENSDLAYASAATAKLMHPVRSRRLEGFQAKSAVSSTPTQVRERKLGDLFEYEIEHPVTIRRNQSALVPIVLRPFEGRPVLLYNRQTRAENPMRCVEFKNTTGLTLEGGPVTVIEGGTYVGEAMLETLKPDEQRLVPYAVELSVSVLDNIDSHNERAFRVVIRNGQLITHYFQVQKTTYNFNNKSDREQIVYLDHPRGGSAWKLHETAEPHEITENFWRFRFTLAAKQVTAFVVQQQQTLQQGHALSDFNDQRLSFWIDQRFLDDKTKKVLKQAFDLRQEIANLEAEIAKLEQERSTIHSEQQRIRENLQALTERTSEKDLRERFVRTLNAQEDRLEKIGVEIKEHVQARERGREKMNALLAKLEYDATV